NQYRFAHATSTLYVGVYQKAHKHLLAIQKNSLVSKPNRVNDVKPVPSIPPHLMPNALLRCEQRNTEASAYHLKH
ncbi:hypothetical protein ACEV92_23405, partial [Vibrio parahaemolyticus]